MPEEKNGGNVFLSGALGDIFTRADEQAKNAPPTLVRSVWLYYLARHFFSRYEATFSLMPRSPLNEYRNALDHFMRFAADNEWPPQRDDNHRNLKKMEAHLQRAVLDICKSHAYRAMERVDEFEKRHDHHILVMVSDGNFLQEWQNKKKEAAHCFSEAKFTDSNLGEMAAENDDIIRLFAKAAQKYIDLNEFGEDCASNIAQAERNHHNISKKSQTLSTWKQATIAIIGAIIGVALTLVVSK